MYRNLRRANHGFVGFVFVSWVLYLFRGFCIYFSDFVFASWVLCLFCGLKRCASSH